MTPAFILAAGKLLIYLVRNLPAAKSMSVPFWSDLFHCDLCLGVWTYFALNCFWNYELTSSLTGIYIPIVSEFITACVMSWTVHIFFLGLKLKYGTFEE